MSTTRIFRNHFVLGVQGTANKILHLISEMDATRGSTEEEYRGTNPSFNSIKHTKIHQFGEISKAIKNALVNVVDYKQYQKGLKKSERDDVKELIAKALYSAYSVEQPPKETQECKDGNTPLTYDYCGSGTSGTLHYRYDAIFYINFFFSYGENRLALPTAIFLNSDKLEKIILKALQGKYDKILESEWVLVDEVKKVVQEAPNLTAPSAPEASQIEGVAALPVDEVQYITAPSAPEIDCIQTREILETNSAQPTLNSKQNQIEEVPHETAASAPELEPDAVLPVEGAPHLSSPEKEVPNLKPHAALVTEEVQHETAPSAPEKDENVVDEKLKPNSLSEPDKQFLKDMQKRFRNLNFIGSNTRQVTDGKQREKELESKSDTVKKRVVVKSELPHLNHHPLTST